MRLGPSLSYEEPKLSMQWQGGSIGWWTFVHFREPGRTHRKIFHTGALAAAAGGFTRSRHDGQYHSAISDVETLRVLDSAAKEAIHVAQNNNDDLELMANISPTLKACYRLEPSVSQMMGIPLQSTKVVRQALEEAKRLGTISASREDQS